MMWGQPPPHYSTADPWYDTQPTYDYGGQDVQQQYWGQLDGALNSYLGGQDVPPPPPPQQQYQTRSWDAQAEGNAKRWAKESSGYAAQAAAQAQRLGLAAGGVGDLASSVGHLSAAVQRMEERTALVQERDSARMRCLELEQALNERALQVKAPPSPLRTLPSAPASPARIPINVTLPLSPNVATSTTGLPPRAPSVNTSTTGLPSQALVHQADQADSNEARRQAIFRERQVILAERQLLAERRKLEEEMERADHGVRESVEGGVPPKVHHPELTEARVQIATLHGEMKEMRALIRRDNGSPRSSVQNKRSRPSSPTTDELAVKVAEKAREDAKRNFERLREELSSHNASLRDQHEAHIESLSKKHTAHLETHKMKLEAEAEAAKVRAGAEVDALRHRLEAATDHLHAAELRREQAHAAAGAELDKRRELLAEEELRRLTVPVPRPSVSESHVGRLVSEKLLEKKPAVTESRIGALLEQKLASQAPAVTESRIGALMEAKLASQQPGVSEAQIARLMEVTMDERMRQHQPSVTESQLGRLMEEKLSSITQQHAEEKHALQAQHLETLHGKIMGLEQESARHRGELEAERLHKDSEIAQLKLKLEETTHAIRKEAPLQAIRREAPLQAHAPAAENIVAAPAAHHKVHHTAAAEDVPTIKKEKKKPSAVWTGHAGSNSRLKKAVKVTWGKGPKPSADKIRAALVEFGVVTKVGETPHGKSELVLFGSEAAALNALEKYLGPWRLRPASATLQEDPFHHVPSPEKAAPSRFAARTVEVTWNESIPPTNDKELRSQLSYFGDVTRSFRTGHRGVVMFSNHDEAFRCVEEYRGPWTVKLVNAKKVPPKAVKRPSTKEEVAARALRVSWRGRSSPPSENDVRDALSNFGTVARCQSGSTHAVVLFGSSREATEALQNYEGPWKLTKAQEHAPKTPAPAEKVIVQTPADVLLEKRKATRKVTWSSEAAVPTEDQLRAVLNSYGPVRQVALKKRSAIVMFRDAAGAQNADATYRGPWRLNPLGKPGQTPKTPPPTQRPAPRRDHSPPRHLSPVKREAPLQAHAPVVEEAVLEKKHHHKAEEEVAHHKAEEEIALPPPAKPARLTAEALAALEAETTQKKAPLPERCVNITWPKHARAPEAGVQEVLRAFGCSDVVKVSCRTKSAVTLFSTPEAAWKAVAKIRDATGTVEGYDLGTWKAFLASEALAIRASKSSAPLSPKQPPSVASSAVRRSQERQRQREQMVAPPPPVGDLWKRCVKVTYAANYAPASEAQLASDVADAGGAPFVNAKLKKKSAVLLFGSTADAEDLVHGVGDSCDKFTASIVPPPSPAPTPLA